MYDGDMTLDEAMRIDAVAEALEDLPDGAFWAALEEQGIYPEEVTEAQEVIEAHHAA